jgi:hypothetical protein
LAWKKRAATFPKGKSPRPKRENREIKGNVSPSPAPE